MFSLSLKSINDSFYREHSQGWIEPVLDSLRFVYEAGKHVEVTNLLIPTVNDTPDEIRRMARWIRDNLHPNVPLHFARYHPDYKFTIPRTSVEQVLEARRLALDEGLRYVYTGNLPGDEGENTFCHSCKEPLIDRIGFHVSHSRITGGCCPRCGAAIPGVW